MEKLIEGIEREMTDVELTNVLVIAQYALYNPTCRRMVQYWTGLTEEECFALAHEITEVVGKDAEVVTNGEA